MNRPETERQPGADVVPRGAHEALLNRLLSSKANLIRTRFARQRCAFSDFIWSIKEPIAGSAVNCAHRLVGEVAEGDLRDGDRKPETRGEGGVPDAEFKSGSETFGFKTRQ